MSSCSGNVITDWKRLWTLVSGIHHETPEQTVRDELLNVSKELQDGLLQFRPISASNTKLESLLQEKKQEKLLPFTQRLQELLDLESKQCWEILCYYLANEYRGSASSLTALISTEGNMTKLLDDIWGYYTLERMIVLKIVKNLLVFYNVANHPYQREYKHLVDKITLEKLCDSYLKQLEHLINESPPSKLTTGEFFNYHAKLIVWSERNAREINEVLHILLLLCEHLPFGLAQVQQLFSCFKQHSFGKQQRYLDSRAHAELLTRLAYSEVLLLLKCFDYADATDAGGSGRVSLARDIVAALGKDVTRMYHNPENGPLLFAWMLLSMRCATATMTEDEQAFLRCRQFGKRAVDLNCFGYMHKMLSHAMFKDDSLVSRIARKTVYNLLTYMCDFFDGDGSCAAHPFIYELLSELLSWPTVAKEFCNNEEGGVRSLYNTLLEVFPVDFVHISMLADALTKAGMGSYIRTQLESLPILTDLYDDSKYALRATGAAEDGEYVLTQSVRPFPRIDFTLTAGTTAAIMSRANGYCVHFRATVNYFNVLHHEINCLLTEAKHGDFRGSERVRRVNAGLRFLESALQRTKTLSGISVEMVHPTEMCVDLLNKFKTVQCPPVELLASCLNVSTALLPLVDAEIFARIINLGILPVITNNTLGDYKKYAHGVCFDSRLVGSYLVDVEKKLERYGFLLAYLGFLRTYTKMQRNRYFEVEIPGLIFLLREVFPHMHAWRFKIQADKNKIYTEIMGFICDILDTTTIVSSVGDDKETQSAKVIEQKQLLRDICVYSLLSLENGIVLLRFVALGNAYLQHTMEMESNWMLQQPHGLVFLVRLSMRILMQLLRLKPTIFTSAAATELTPLEALIYTQPKQRDTLRIIPVVTSYMSNIFDRWLPILSCRLLKRIALEFNMSLLACLDMEPDQIRLTFLQKLPDELESDSLKIAVLELVEACIEKQPGVTEAFFKVNYAQEKRLFCGSSSKDSSSQIADSILTFVEDYLEAVARDPHTVEHALPSKIMNLFHSLWKQNMQILVDELVQKPNFWSQLCNPLFGELRPQLRVYTQLLNILAIEIYCTRPLTHNTSATTALKGVVLKFFEPAYFDKWLDYVFDMPKTPAVLPLANEPIGDEMPEWLCRLQAFKGFLLILLKKQPQFVEIPQRQFKTLAVKCLCVLVDRAEYAEDLRPFILLTEMYLFIILSFKHSYTESTSEDREMLCQLLQLLCRVAACYEDLHQRAKEACLSITIKSAELLADELLQDSTLAISFLNSVVSIICSELQNLENCVKAEHRTQKVVAVETLLEQQHQSLSTSNSLILSLNLLKTTATIFHNNGPGNWDWPFIANKVFQRLLSCTGAILPLYSKQQLSVELLDVLIVFAKGNCSAEFLHCDVGDYLWLRLLPPKELLEANYSLGKPCSADWTVQKWWPIYARGIELVTILFQKHSNHFLKEVLQFVGIHEEYLMDSLQLGKQSLEPLAMDLIKAAITLVASLVEFEKQWRLENSQSLFNLMRSVQMLMGHSISMFHQPRNLKCLVAGRRSQLDILRDSENAGLVDEVITAFNDLTEIIILSVKCLQRFSPDLLDLICAPEFQVNKWEPLFEIHFGAPKMTENAITLTFGTVLSIVGVYTKVLNLQSYGFHEVPLNVLPTIDGGGNNPPATSCHSTTPTAATPALPNNSNATLGVVTSQRPFSKSLSVTSVSSSANCPPNELLSNLDGELCLMALEHILTLAASQSMLALKNLQLPPREKQLIRREISTELISYHEFVRKKVLSSSSGGGGGSGEHKEIWHRRKHGQLLMMQPNGDAIGAHSSYVGSGAQMRSAAAGSRHSTDTRNSMRVNVVRRLHLQQQRTPEAAAGPFEMSQFVSPIVGLVHSQDPTAQAATTSSTPNFARPPIRRQSDEQMPHASETHTKRVYFSDDTQQDDIDEGQEEDDEIQYLPPEEPKCSPLSYVQLIEEDYLHFMSNLFSVICQSD